MSKPRRKRKTIPDSEVSGQKGINVIEEKLLDMGFLWHPAGPFDPGIDGRIELRDTRTGEPLHTMIGAQGKGYASYTAETDDSFEFLCDEADLHYWMNSNTPVLLICTHPKTREAWFKCVTDWFADPERRIERRIYFDKRADTFDASCASDLLRLGQRPEPTSHRRPAAPPETLLSNLLPIQQHGKSIWSAPTDLWDHRGVRLRYDEIGEEQRASDYIIRDQRLYSLRDPRTCALRHLCDTDQVERVDAHAWSDSDDPKFERYWVELLRRTLLQQVKGKLRWHPLRNVFYFPAPEPLADQAIIGPKGLPRGVIKVEYFLDKDTKEQRLSYIRHHAFSPGFEKIGDTWHLTVDHDYLFTRDGEQETIRADERRAGIKRIERNLAIASHLRTWEHVLTEPPSLFEGEAPLLVFGPLVTVESSVGIDDSAWRGKDKDADNSGQQELVA